MSSVTEVSARLSFASETTLPGPRWRSNAKRYGVVEIRKGVCGTDSDGEGLAGREEPGELIGS